MDDRVDKGRRRFLTNVTVGVGAVGGVLAAVPFVRSMAPSERAKAAGAPVEIDISKLEPGQMIKEEWRGKPVWIVNRTEKMLASLAELLRQARRGTSADDSLADAQRLAHRLKGTSGTYGLQESSAALEHVEEQLGLLRDDACDPHDAWARIERALERARARLATPRTR